VGHGVAVRSARVAWVVRGGGGVLGGDGSSGASGPRRCRVTAVPESLKPGARAGGRGLRSRGAVRVPGRSGGAGARVLWGRTTERGGRDGGWGVRVVVLPGGRLLVVAGWWVGGGRTTIGGGGGGEISGAGSVVRVVGLRVAVVLSGHRAHRVVVVVLHVVESRCRSDVCGDGFRRPATAGGVRGVGMFKMPHGYRAAGSRA